MQIVSNTALVSINETLIIQLISFLIFLFIINRLMFRPLRKVMNQRETHIERIRQEIVAAQVELENYTHQIEERKEAVRSEAFGSTKKLEAQGRQQADEIMKAVEREIAQLREQALNEVNGQITEARKDIKKEAEKLAFGLMEQVLGRKLAS